MYVIYDKMDLSGAVVGETLADALARYMEIFPTSIDDGDTLMAFKSNGTLYQVDVEPRLIVVKKSGTSKK